MSYNENGRRSNNSWNNNIHREKPRAVFPEGYLENGYFKVVDGRDCLKPEYIVEYPQKIADTLEMDGNNNQNKQSQIRKFYEYLLQVQEKLRRSDSRFEVIEADFVELIPFVKYAKERKRVTQFFVDFIKKNVQTVKNERDFHAFVKHFEAVIAFLKKDS